MSDALDLDVLAVSPHPDDVELFCGGTLARMAAMGHRVGVLDLTRGELATNGTPEARAAEATAAAEVLGLVHRENLGLPDGFVDAAGAPSGLAAPTPADTQVGRLVEALRRLRPELVLAPSAAARHPDHAAASALVTRAVFFAHVGGFVTEPPRPRWAPRELMYYTMRCEATPSLCVDISAATEIKRRAIRCYASQIERGGSDASTLVNDPRSVAAVWTRDAYWGAHIGVDAAEPFVVRGVAGVGDPVAWIRAQPGRAPLLFKEGP